MNGVIVKVAAGKFMISAPFTCLGECQRIPSRRYIKKTRAWVAPITKMNSEYLLRVFKAAHWQPEAAAAAAESANRKPPERLPFPEWFPFRTKPFKHQVTALNKMWSCKPFGLFMEMGLGKTKATIDVACARAIDNQINAVLVLSPLSVVLSWRDEIRQHSTVKSNIHVVRSRQTRTITHDHGVELVGGMDWYLANTEGLSAGGLYDAIVSHVAGKNLLMVIDECTDIKNHEASRTKKCFLLSAFARYRMILTGKAVLQGPADLFSQFQFLDPDIIGAGDFYCFRNRYVVMGGYENKEVIGYQNLDELARLIEPYVYSVTKKEALDLPPKVYKVVRVEMADEQKAMIKQIQRHGVAGTRVLKNVLEKVLRLQQVAAGIRPATDDSPELPLIEPKRNPKLLALLDVLKEFDGQFIVWCNFKFEVGIVEEALRDAGISFATHTGDTNRDARKDVIDDFQAGKVRGFVGTVQSGGIGITLTAATLVVYMSNSWSLKNRAQSEDRAHRIGQSKSVLYVDLVADESVDELVMNALRDKKDLSDYVRDLIENSGRITGVEV